MERVESQTPFKLGTVDIPPIPAQGRAEVGYSVPGPRSTAQSTEGPEGFIAWSLECTWSAGSWRRQGAAPIVISMPAVSRQELEGGQPWWQRIRPGRGRSERSVEDSTRTA